MRGGLEGAGIIATLKHFAGYAVSRGARNHAPVRMGPRELADTVLPPFETAVRLGGARSVMTSYADVDGVPGTANAELLGRVLRDSWGFEGTVVADYWAIPFLATMHHVAADVPSAGALALRAGVDVEPPATAGYASLAALVRDGRVDEAEVDQAVERHLRQKIEAGLLDGGPVVPVGAEHVDLDSPRNRAISSQLAAESVVLLRNEEVLPIAPATKVALLGPAAAQFRSLSGATPSPTMSCPSIPAMSSASPSRRCWTLPSTSSDRTASGTRRAAACSTTTVRGSARPPLSRARATSPSSWSATSRGCSVTARRAKGATRLTCGCRAGSTTW